VATFYRRPYRLLNTLKNDKNKRYAATVAAGNSVTANYVEALPAQRPPALRNASINVFDKNLAISELYRSAAKVTQVRDSNSTAMGLNTNTTTNSTSNNPILSKSSVQSPFETLKKLNAEREMLSSLWLTACAASECFPKETYTANHQNNTLPPLGEIIHHNNILASNAASCMPLGMCFATVPQQHQIVGPTPGHCEALVQLHMRQCFGQQQQDSSDLLAREMVGINGMAGLHLLASASAQHLECSQQQQSSGAVVVPPQSHQMMQRQQQHNSAQLPAIKPCNMNADSLARLSQSILCTPVTLGHPTTACK
jgi:hypothetical protein